MENHKLSKSRSYRLVGLSRSAYNRPRLDWVERDREAVDVLNGLSMLFPRLGFLRYCALLSQRGFSPGTVSALIARTGRWGSISHVQPRRGCPPRDSLPVEVPNHPNDVRPTDFMNDALCYGARLRLFNAIDNHSGEDLWPLRWIPH